MAAPQAHSATILLVEDEPSVQALSRRVLSRAGFQVLLAATPSEALALADDHEVDLVVSDVAMPEMSGPLLAAALARKRPALRVLFVSGYTLDDLVERGMGDAGIDLLSKPFSPQELVDRVRAALAR